MQNNNSYGVQDSFELNGGNARPVNRQSAPPYAAPVNPGDWNNLRDPSALPTPQPPYAAPYNPGGVHNPVPGPGYNPFVTPPQGGRQPGRSITPPQQQPPYAAPINPGGGIHNPVPGPSYGTTPPSNQPPFASPIPQPAPQPPLNNPIWRAPQQPAPPQQPPYAQPLPPNVPGNGQPPPFQLPPELHGAILQHAIQYLDRHGRR